MMRSSRDHANPPPDVKLPAGSQIFTLAPPFVGTFQILPLAE
jgi:hypothetical protein